MKGTGGLIIVVLGLLVLWLAVTGKLADMLAGVKKLGEPDAVQKPTSAPASGAGPSGPSVLSLAGVGGMSSLPGLGPLPVLPNAYANN